MKKTIQILAAAVLVLVAAWAVMWYGCGVRKIMKGDTVAVFAHDIGVFVEAHDGRLPQDWRELDQWWQAREGKSRWPADETEKRIELMQEPYAVSNGVPRFVRIIDRQVEGMEDYVNRSIYGVLIKMGKTDAANHTSDGIRQPADGSPKPSM